MKKVMEEKQRKGGSKTSTATSTRRKNTSGKESAAKEAAIVKFVKKERKEKNQLKIQSCVRSSPVVGKDEEVVIEDFDSQELLHETAKNCCTRRLLEGFLVMLKQPQM